MYIWDTFGESIIKSKTNIKIVIGKCLLTVIY